MSHLRCGRAPFELRRCAPTDAAVRQQGPSCIRAARRIPALLAVKRANNCSLPTPPDPDRDPYERAADREAARLRATFPTMVVEADAAGLNPVVRPDSVVVAPTR